MTKANLEQTKVSLDVWLDSYEDILWGSYFYTLSRGIRMKKIKRMFRYENVGILFVFPAFLYMLIFVGYPIIRNIILSFQDVGAGNLVRGTKNFILFDNYMELFQDSVFKTSLWNTLRYTVLCLVFQFIIGFALAIFFNQSFTLAKPVRGLLLVSWMIPVTVTALIFKLLFATDIGVINYILRSLHLINKNIEWLTTPGTAMFALICANVFRYDTEEVWIEPWGANAIRVRATKEHKMPEENWALHGRGICLRKLKRHMQRRWGKFP